MTTYSEFKPGQLVQISETCCNRGLSTPDKKVISCFSEAGYVYWWKDGPGPAPPDEIVPCGAWVMIVDKIENLAFYRFLHGERMYVSLGHNFIGWELAG